MAKSLYNFEFFSLAEYKQWQKARIKIKLVKRDFWMYTSCASPSSYLSSSTILSIQHYFLFLLKKIGHCERNYYIFTRCYAEQGHTNSPLNKQGAKIVSSSTSKTNSHTPEGHYHSCL